MYVEFSSTFVSGLSRVPTIVLRFFSKKYMQISLLVGIVQAGQQNILGWLVFIAGFDSFVVTILVNML